MFATAASAHTPAIRALTSNQVREASSLGRPLLGARTT
ncbi:hypothetical protein J2Z21_009623 [Streptomyces griseochromogenes]|uniref:FXSXX-COOH protein n=1 Tax=Streptomyces griseochromogenes TaxID=68214 RepID=A0ABS4MAA4_9ACTN|nr:hypothetical protein [Streptomyces griseochromogenes]